jgi:hypothetical protein
MKPGRSCCSWLSFTLIYIEYMSMPGLSVSLSSAIIESVAFSLLSTTQELYAFTVFERVFKEFGLPQAIRTDNRVPGLLLPAFIGDVHRSLSSAAVPTLQLSKVCPRCGEPVIRAPRRPIDRVTSLIRQVERYQCIWPQCGWIGNLPSAPIRGKG